MSAQEWIRVSTVAGQLGLSSQAVRNLIRSGKLDAAKDPEGRWLLNAASVEEYLALRGRHKPPILGLAGVERELQGIAENVRALRESGATTSGVLEELERERDRYRAEATAARAASLSLISASRETRAALGGLLDSMRHHEDALIQLLTPGTAEDLSTPRGNKASRF
ncbi:MAG TPA: helix-turn-helix domain-containing protein [Microbacteriaceae bacterium]|jgi:excisionase family DNA binding protein|nr:helix-turn-helix domain-containing protein [Microbacteriaceae bacterium]